MKHFADVLLQHTNGICIVLGTACTGSAVILVAPDYAPAEGVLAAKVVFSLAMLFLAGYDWRTHLVPPQVSIPLMFAGLGVVVARGVLWHDLSALPYLVGVFVLFALNLIAGGDAKLALGFFALWPNPSMFWALVLSHIVIGVPLLVRKYLHTPARQLAHGVAAYALSGQPLPSEQDLAQGDPATLMYAAAAIAYVWLLIH